MNAKVWFPCGNYSIFRVRLDNGEYYDGHFKEPAKVSTCLSVSWQRHLRKDHKPNGKSNH
jgi:hypothetical protein